MSRGKFFVALFVLVLGVGALSPSALAAQPVRFHDHFFDEIQDVDVCGVNVDIVAQGVFTELIFLDDEGNFVGFMSMVSGTNTFTADNGKSVVVQFAGQFSEAEPVVDETAGTISFISSNKGLPEKIIGSGGPVLLRDAGLISFAETFDLATGAFISFEIIANKGPHPEADSDFTLFCDVISAALA